MSFNMYLKMCIWDYLLVCVAGVSLTYVVLDSFYINPSLQYSVLPGVIAVALVTALFLVAFNRRTARIGGVLVGLACVGGIMVAAAFSPSAFMTDTEETYFYFAIVCVLVPLLSFALSRAHAGSVVLFGAGSFICAWMQFFYEFYELTWTLLFVISSLMLVIYKNYQLNARAATSVRKLSFTAGFLVALGAVIASVGVACLVWVCIISPLNPGALEIKLIQEYRALEEVPVVGTSSELMMPNMDLTSDDLSEQERTTDDLVEDEEGRQMPARAVPLQSTQEEQSGSFMGIDIDAITEIFDPKTYDEQTYPWFLLALLIIPIALIAYFVGRRVYRTVRLNRIRKLPLNQQVEQLYLFIVKLFSRIGFAVPEGATLLEFARNNESSMEYFQKEAGVSFVAITEVYVACTYGQKEATQAQVDKFVLFYKSFWKAARKMLGNMKYLVKSFRL